LCISGWKRGRLNEPGSTDNHLNYSANENNGPLLLGPQPLHDVVPWSGGSESSQHHQGLPQNTGDAK